MVAILAEEMRLEEEVENEKTGGLEGQENGEVIEDGPEINSEEEKLPEIKDEINTSADKEGVIDETLSFDEDEVAEM